MSHAILDDEASTGMQGGHGAGGAQGRDGVEPGREEEEWRSGLALDGSSLGRGLGLWSGEGALEGPIGAKGPGRAGDADGGPVGAHEGRHLELLVDVATPPACTLVSDAVAVGAEYC